ncbi:hypothetical protein [Pseudovibrio sp. Ad37]|uniref:hypothetical protein n=1 Tax=Pseudovibrio sp. Ad37 TaxID=989422 RepID=UPI0007B1E986|nr:hypothetical protein [Pseudovibrio sp. Ad37]KZL24225.1 hypothetical protein PsAD37_02796 [Pseudovibrio sp. Ad37]
MILRLFTCWQAYLLIAAFALFTGYYNGAWWFFVSAVVSPLLRNLSAISWDESTSEVKDPLGSDMLDPGSHVSPATQIIDFTGFAENGPNDGSRHYVPTSSPF